MMSTKELTRLAVIKSAAKGTARLPRMSFQRCPYVHSLILFSVLRQAPTISSPIDLQ
jgi:hypothetical protein